MNVKKTWIQMVVVLALLGASLMVSAEEPTATPQVNVNEASPVELAYLPGVGPSTAQRIVVYREKQKFKKPQQLMRVKGIGRKTFQKLQQFICVSGPTTATKKIKNPPNDASSK